MLAETIQKARAKDFVSIADTLKLIGARKNIGVMDSLENWCSIFGKHHFPFRVIYGSDWFALVGGGKAPGYDGILLHAIVPYMFEYGRSHLMEDSSAKCYLKDTEANRKFLRSMLKVSERILLRCSTVSSFESAMYRIVSGKTSWRSSP